MEDLVTSAVYIRTATGRLYCRLITIGVVYHVTACRDRIPFDVPIVITPSERPAEIAIPGCLRDLVASKPTRDLRPSVRVLGVPVEVEIEDEQDDWTEVDESSTGRQRIH
jgi:hypothetical protein